MKKTVVSFDQIGYEQTINALRTNVSKLTKCLDYIEVITGSRTLKTLAEISDFICSQTKFKNIFLSATLLEVDHEYKYLEDNLDTINHEVIEYVDNVPITKESVLKATKESHTEYLQDKFANDYELLNKAIELLNKVSNSNLVNCLKSDHNKKFTINLFQLNNSDRI